MGFFIAVLVVLLIVWLVESPTTCIIGIVAFMVFSVWLAKTDNKKKEEQRQKKLKEDEKNNKIFEEKKLQYNISNGCFTVNYKKGFAKIASGKQYIWVKDDKIFLFPATAQSIEQNYILYKIPLKDIEYFSTEGIISQETRISGGGGEVGGSSISGAVVGGMIAGNTGAIIGSRKKGKIDPIKSQVITHDDRETYLSLYIDGEKKSLFFNYDDYTTFLKLIPQKDYNNFVNTQISKGSESSDSSAIEQLKDLADLKEKGILTEDEFNEKKKVLLDKIK